MSAPSDREVALYWKPLPDGVHEVIVYPIYGGARFCYGLLDDWVNIDDTWYYEDSTLAVRAAQLWNGQGDPLDGWFRTSRGDRYRDGGDPQKETVPR